MLEAENLECERGGRVLFRQLSFALQPGELMRVSGGNGRGKTSLLRILCGLLAPRSGQVRWGGAPIGGLREEYSRQLVYIGHAPAVKDDLSAAENLSITCRLAGIPAPAAAIREALERFGLPPRPVPAKRLSQGQRRRAALARLALAQALPLWLLDEPFAALDTAAAALVEGVIGQQVARGGMVVYTTHQEARIDGVTPRVLDLEGLHA